MATVSLTTVEFAPEGEGTRLVLVEAGATSTGGSSRLGEKKAPPSG